MRCPSCHADNIKGADYCSNCGHDLAGTDLPTPTRESAFVYEPVSTLPAIAPVSVRKTDPVGLAVKRMQTENAPCVLVTDGDGLAGIITPWDLLHKVAGPREDLNAVTCAEVMTPDPVCLKKDDSIAVAINKMAVGEFRHIPVVENGRPVSIVSIDDIFHHISPLLA